ncbi:yippee zinc-binding/DNA-binding /Mis18, centromere assembly-domain-containing protein [Pyronema domesticum]|uniref:Protein yippee-like n=1 Tax=Pyronema omphalodes (strain CBS 100304) TaxID=1076935 RepID=U4L5P7_PYROM|nr:yippee zinc-binding/DNA-binding /Mis18, centromere assembly-domain-containing protein [Pyronema domesticum]CCX07746.1 Similar to Protein yippee-like At3g08990; acc. no. Q9SR97 [Pyronema omphalodes CBS 100304]
MSLSFLFPRYLTPSLSPSSAPPHLASTLLACRVCHSHLCPSSSIISKTFTGRYGRAYLLSSSSLNTSTVTLLRPQERHLVTGLHTVSDYECARCGAELGWRYDDAKEASQKYKVGKWILEREKVREVRGAGDNVEETVQRLLRAGEEGIWEVDWEGGFRG